VNGFEVFVILLVIANAVAAILKKRAAKNRQGTVPAPHRKREQPAGTTSTRGSREIRAIEPRRFEHRAGLEEGTAELGTIEADLSTALERIQSEDTYVGVKQAAAPVSEAAGPRSRIAGLQSKSDLRQAVLLSEILLPPRALRPNEAELGL